MWIRLLRSKSFWFGLAVSIAGLAIAIRGVESDQLREHLSRTPWVWAFGIGLISLSASMIRSYRWKVAIDSFSPVPLSKVASAFMVGILGLNVIPARVGELLRVLVLGRNSTNSRSSILATVVFERVIDALVIITIFVAAFVLIPQVGSGIVDAVVSGVAAPDAGNPDAAAASAAQAPDSGRKILLCIIPVIFCACLFVLYSLRCHLSFWQRMLGRFAARLGRIGTKLPGVLERFSSGLVIITHPSRMLAYIALSFGAWLTYSLYLYANFRMLGIDLGFKEAIVVTTATVVGAMIPAAPGFVGTYHFFCQLALRYFDVPAALAVTFAVVTHAVPYILHTIIGFFCALRENVRLNDLASPASEEAGR